MEATISVLDYKFSVGEARQIYKELKKIFGGEGKIPQTAPRDPIRYPPLAVDQGVDPASYPFSVYSVYYE